MRYELCRATTKCAESHVHLSVVLYIALWYYISVLDFRIMHWHYVRVRLRFRVTIYWYNVLALLVANNIHPYTNSPAPIEVLRRFWKPQIPDTLAIQTVSPRRVAIKTVSPRRVATVGAYA